MSRWIWWSWRISILCFKRKLLPGSQWPCVLRYEDNSRQFTLFAWVEWQSRCFVVLTCHMYTCSLSPYYLSTCNLSPYYLSMYAPRYVAYCMLIICCHVIIWDSDGSTAITKIVNPSPILFNIFLYELFSFYDILNLWISVISYCSSVGLPSVFYIFPRRIILSIH